MGRSANHVPAALALLTLSGWVTGCGVEPLSEDQLADPAACADCHPAHFQEWQGSMHAYAATDPVFRAMNARGQRETNGELGDFCVQCHAPMAVREGLTTDGLNLDEVPDHMQGVTCAFCHLADEVRDDHNNPIKLATDWVMRGGISNPSPQAGHASAWSPLHDRNEVDSADMCGSCHDVVNGHGLRIESTFVEWQESQYATTDAGLVQTCGSCHMQGRDDVAAALPGMKTRRVHSHTFAGVDVALTDFPHKEDQAAEIQRALDTTVLSELEVFDAGVGTGINVTLENLSAGHSFPSGATQDRRAWVELVAYQGDEVIWSSGVVAEDQPLSALDDPSLWWFGHDTFAEDGEPAHMFWEVASMEGELLLAPEAGSPIGSGNHVTRLYSLPDLYPDRITLRVLLRPFKLDVLHDLVQSGDLDPALVEEVPTWELRAATREWRKE